MRYDSNGLRTQKGDIHYYYDSDNNLIATVNGEHTLFFYYDESGSVTSFSLGGSMYFYVKNLQGDIINIADSNGTILVRYDYDVVGKIVNITDYSDPNVTGVQDFALINPLRYRGYVYDDETGLYYLQSRYYDSVTGRFLNADSYTDTESGSPLSTNMFAYCENNSLFSSDTTGHWDKKLHASLCKKVGFNSTVISWVQKADLKFGGDNLYSSPFHSRGRGCYPDSLQIAVYLYNKAIDILKNPTFKSNKQKYTFTYSFEEGCENLSIYYLGYLVKGNDMPNKGKIVVSTKGAKALIKDLNKLSSRKQQSDALIGLALHVLQDHFAHLVMLDVYRGTLKSRNHLQFCSATTFSTTYAGGTGAFEDKTDEIPWRYYNTKRITNDIYEYYFTKTRIKNISKQITTQSKYYYFFKSYILSTQEYYLLIN